MNRRFAIALRALLGMIAIAIGGAISAWTLYNTLIERLPQYRGSLIPSVGIGLPMIAVGVHWLRTPRRTALPTGDDAAREDGGAR